MPSNATCTLLNRLWVIHSYSLVSYLTFAPPDWTDADGSAAQLLTDIAEGQSRLADRIGKLIIQYGGQLPQGTYPDRFTALHDLSPEYMWSELLDYQQRSVDAIDQLVPQLRHTPVAQALAQECLGAAKAHLDSLRERSRGASAQPT